MVDDLHLNKYPKSAPSYQDQPCNRWKYVVKFQRKGNFENSFSETEFRYHPNLCMQKIQETLRMGRQKDDLNPENIIQCKGPLLFYLCTKCQPFCWSHCWEIYKCITQPAYQRVRFSSQMSTDFSQWEKPIVLCWWYDDVFESVCIRKYLEMLKWVNLEDKGR